MGAARSESYENGKTSPGVAINSLYRGSKIIIKLGGDKPRPYKFSFVSDLRFL